MEIMQRNGVNTNNVPNAEPLLCHTLSMQRYDILEKSDLCVMLVRYFFTSLVFCTGRVVSMTMSMRG